MLYKKSAEIEGAMLGATEEEIESAISGAMARIRENPKADAIECTKEYDGQFLNNALSKAQVMVNFFRELASSDRFKEQKSLLKKFGISSSKERDSHLSQDESERRIRIREGQPESIFLDAARAGEEVLPEAIVKPVFAKPALAKLAKSATLSGDKALYSK